jgi:membrane protease YdiL (CAAX protease family)
VAELVSPNLAESTEDTLIAFSPPKGEAAAEQLIATADLPMVKKWWPIIISSFAFAMAHFGHGTDPIPLFLVALGLGWLYQRTHRLWPCVVVHMALNGFSMLQLAHLIFVGDPTALQ